MIALQEESNRPRIISRICGSANTIHTMKPRLGLVLWLMGLVFFSFVSSPYAHSAERTTTPIPPQQTKGEETLSLLGYFCGNHDGKLDVVEMAVLSTHHLGAVILVMYVGKPREFAMESLKESKEMAAEKEYAEAYEAGEVGLAIVTKARWLSCLNKLCELKGGAEFMGPNGFAELDMADLGAAFLVLTYSWDTDEIQGMFQKSAMARKGYAVYMKAVLIKGFGTIMPTNIHTRRPAPKLNLRYKVNSRVRELSGGSFSPADIAELYHKIPGETVEIKARALSGEENGVNR